MIAQFLWRKLKLILHVLMSGNCQKELCICIILNGCYLNKELEKLFIVWFVIVSNTVEWKLGRNLSEIHFMGGGTVYS